MQKWRAKMGKGGREGLKGVVSWLVNVTDEKSDAWYELLLDMIRFDHEVDGFVWSRSVLNKWAMACVMCVYLLLLLLLLSLILQFRHNIEQTKYQQTVGLCRELINWLLRTRFLFHLHLHSSLIDFNVIVSCNFIHLISLLFQFSFSSVMCHSLSLQ
jgi:hypothetical protein